MVCVYRVCFPLIRLKVLPADAAVDPYILDGVAPHVGKVLVLFYTFLTSAWLFAVACSIPICIYT